MCAYFIYKSRKTCASFAVGMKLFRIVEHHKQLYYSLSRTKRYSRVNSQRGNPFNGLSATNCNEIEKQKMISGVRCE